MEVGLPTNLLDSREQEGFDSGNFSENDPATSAAAANLQHSLPSLAINPSSPYSSPSRKQTSTSTCGSGGRVTRRTNLHPEFNSEEYLYSPNALLVDNSNPLATSTPKNHCNMTSASDSRSRSSSLSPCLQNLLQNFNSLYEQKLAEAETVTRTSKSGGNPMEMKNLIMEEWIRDLNEQNTVLVETVDEMEKEAEEKIQTLQSKVQRSAQMLIDHMHIIQEYEKQVQGFVHNREETVRQLDMFYVEAGELLNKKQALEEKLETVESEHLSLVKLITRIRDWGVWDISGLEFNAKTYKLLFDLYPRLPGSEVQTVFTQERARQVRENELKLHGLSSAFEKLQEHQTTSEKLALEKEKLIADLQKERIELNTKISALEVENQDYRRRLEETQGLLTKTIILANKTTSNSNDVEINQLIHELKELKEELYIARSERQTAMMEATALKAEMNHRLTEMAQMKILLSTLQTESKLTKDKIHEIDENQVKLTTLNEQAKFYAQKYNEVKNLLTNKSTTIENLQSQLDLVYEKLSHMENEIGRWVFSRRGSKPSSTQINHTLSILELNQNNNVSNPIPPQQPDLLMSVRELQIRLRRLEEEATEKDAIVKNLQIELIEIKSAKDEMQGKILSRDAEIQMQKDLMKDEKKTREGMIMMKQDSITISEHDTLDGKRRIKDGDPSSILFRWSPEEISEAEKDIDKLKLGSEVLSARTDLLEKNFLMYNSYQFLTRLENDYLPFVTSAFRLGNGRSNVKPGDNNASTSGTCVEENLEDNRVTKTLQRQLLKEKDKSSKFRFLVMQLLDLLERIILYNKANSNSRSKEKGNVRKIEQMQEVISAMERDEERKFEKQNVKTLLPNKKISDSHVPKYLSKFTSTKSDSAGRVEMVEDSGKTTAMEEIIRLQSEQIQRFENYVNRLHEEIRECMTYDEGKHVSKKVTLDPEVSPSVIGALRYKIEQEIQDFHSKETAMSLHNQLEEMKVELTKSKKNETELCIENEVLRDIIAHVKKANSK